ncbi:hypothetical protein [Corynebacterium durum]|jgi:hypothetical protein blinB_03437|uniref:hypothetical protein n=1 Tax=Corynebacterium durum TaxID=61592 RepID=UPI00288A10F1|nr:hypothetical protein [Corynebacterium durum]
MNSPHHADRERLTGYMERLSTGLEKIKRDYSRFIDLEDEDPETFGAGHFVLYPDGESHARFAIEEHYTGTDWSDPDRLPTSWSWKAEERTRQPSGDYQWSTHASGRVQAADVDQLIDHARAWAQSVRAQTLRAESFETVSGAHRQHQRDAPGQGL